jgi:hypothetical protein
LIERLEIIIESEIEEKNAASNVSWFPDVFRISFTQLNTTFNVEFRRAEMLVPKSVQSNFHVIDDDTGEIVKLEAENQEVIAYIFSLTLVLLEQTLH